MEPPLKPEEADCCNSGCNPCILDVYEEQLRKFTANTQTAQKSTTNCLCMTSFSVFKLINIEQHTKYSNLYTFEFLRQEKIKSSNASVLYEPGQYLLLKATVHGEMFQKAYTPIYIENQPSSCFSVLVKLYENGQMSRYFQRLSIGCETSWRGPYGDYIINYNHKSVLFIAQGTGITPFYSIICNMLNNEVCYTFLTLFFCCNTDNLMLREEFYKLKDYWNFNYELFISNGNEGSFEKKFNETVNFSRLDVKTLESHMENKKEDLKVLICGTETFCDNIRDSVVQCGVSVNDIIVF